MLTEEKIREIQKQLRSGVPEGEVKNDLISQGFTEEEISKVFIPHKPDMRSWYLVSAILLLVVGVYVATINGGMLVIVLSAIMFSVYYSETKKWNK